MVPGSRMLVQPLDRQGTWRFDKSAVRTACETTCEGGLTFGMLAAAHAVFVRRALVSGGLRMRCLRNYTQRNALAFAMPLQNHSTSSRTNAFTHACKCTPCAVQMCVSVHHGRARACARVRVCACALTQLSAAVCTTTDLASRASEPAMSADHIGCDRVQDTTVRGIRYG